MPRFFRMPHVMNSKRKEKTFFEDLRCEQTRRAVQAFRRYFKLFFIFSVVYGLIFINYIDILIQGGYGYHLWLIVMYFFPFVVLSLIFPHNWPLTIGLGLLSSLMNDMFYGPIKYLVGVQLDLTSYYTLRLLPSNVAMFKMDVGFAVVQIYSWTMVISIYSRIVLIVVLWKVWNSQTRVRCLSEESVKAALLS